MELDSERHHGSVTARRRDGLRDRDAAPDGWRVVRVPTEVRTAPTGSWPPCGLRSWTRAVADAT
ncbi:MAG TPA: hypothetical protein VHF25_02785 [Nitriliruptorales bacterium]|nr:hypothetical protein [Nitriliruptorales bacterium]